MILAVRRRASRPDFIVGTAVLGQTILKNHITGTIVPITGLSHRADVDQQLTLAQVVFQVDLIGLKN